MLCIWSLTRSIQESKHSTLINTARHCAPGSLPGGSGKVLTGMQVNGNKEKTKLRYYSAAENFMGNQSTNNVSYFTESLLKTWSFNNPFHFICECCVYVCVYSCVSVCARANIKTSILSILLPGNFH